MEDISFAQKITFAIIQGTSILFLFGFAATLAASGVLLPSSVDDKEPQVAKKTAVAYGILSIFLWLLNWILA